MSYKQPLEEFRLNMQPEQKLEMSQRALRALEQKQKHWQPPPTLAEGYKLFWEQPVEQVAAQTHVELWGGPLDATVWMYEGDVKTAGHYEYVLKYPVGGKYVKETIDNVVRLTYYGPEDFD
jgi:hypothetical protein